MIGCAWVPLSLLTFEMNGKVMLCGAVHEPRPNDIRGS